MTETAIITSQKDSLEITIRKVLIHNDHVNKNQFHALSANEDNQNNNEELQRYHQKYYIVATTRTAHVKKT